MSKTTYFENASLFIADWGPMVTYYTVGSFATRSIACYAAAGFGLFGSCLDFTNSQLNPGKRPWPRLLNTTEMVVYLSMAILFQLQTNCKMWGNFLQMAGICIAMACGMFTKSHSIANDIEREDDVNGLGITNSTEVKHASKEIAWILTFGFIGMTFMILAVPLYRIIHGEPADDEFRLLFNWVFPLLSLGIALVAVGYKGKQLGEIRLKAASETSSLLRQDSKDDKQDNDHPAIFFAILVLALIPTIIIASVSGGGGDTVCY